jgi:hypothetical protein
MADFLPESAQSTDVHQNCQKSVSSITFALVRDIHGAVACFIHHNAMQVADNLHDVDFVLEGFLVEVPVAANQSLDCDPDVRPVVLVPDPANLKEQTEGLAFSNDGCKQCRTAKDVV